MHFNSLRPILIKVCLQSQAYEDDELLQPGIPGKPFAPDMLFAVASPPHSSARTCVRGFVTGAVVCTIPPNRIARTQTDTFEGDYSDCPGSTTNFGRGESRLLRSLPSSLADPSQTR